MTPLAKALLSLVCELRRSIRFYNKLGKKHLARQALKQACFYLRWARNELYREPLQ